MSQFAFNVGTSNAIAAFVDAIRGHVSVALQDLAAGAQVTVGAGEFTATYSESTGLQVSGGPLNTVQDALQLIELVRAEIVKPAPEVSSDTIPIDPQNDPPVTITTPPAEPPPVVTPYVPGSTWKPTP
jgi:hypothetical protein